MALVLVPPEVSNFILERHVRSYGANDHESYHCVSLTSQHKIELHDISKVGLRFHEIEKIMDSAVEAMLKFSSILDVLPN